jgi:hypothetical protein
MMCYDVKGGWEPTMNVTISDDAERIAREERERLNRQIEEGLAQLDRGEGIPGDQAFQALWERSQKRREAR